MPNVEIFQKGTQTIAQAGGRQIATCPVKGNARALFKAAIDAAPNGGSMKVGKGLYVFSAPYALPLNPDGSNIFYCSIPMVDKFVSMEGAGAGQTIFRLAPGQRRPGRHVAFMMVGGKRAFDLGYSSFSLKGITFDGASHQQDLSYLPHDGEAMVLARGLRSNGVYENLEFRRSPGAGLYLGNNGSGPGTNETVRNVVARDCRAEGIMLDTNRNSRVEDCQAYNCGVGLFLNGNDDFATRGPDNVTATRVKTDSQITLWQVNNFTLDHVEMNCVGATKSRGLVVRDGYGTVKGCTLKTDQTKNDARSGPGATYIYEAAKVRLEKCNLAGYLGVHVIGSSQVEVNNCQITAPGGCFCTTDPNPVSSSIIAEGCTCAGKKTALQSGSTFEER
jgi:hypothetical protein